MQFLNRAACSEVAQLSKSRSREVEKSKEIFEQVVRVAPESQATLATLILLEITVRIESLDAAEPNHTT